MELSKYAELFLSESREHISAINQHLLVLEEAPDDSEAVDAVYRSLHTIKGLAATMGYAGLTALAHAMEDLLDQLRRGMRRADPPLVDLLFRATDAVEAAAEAAVSGAGPEPDLDDLLEALAGSGEPAEAPPERPDDGFGPGASDPGDGLVIGVTVDPNAPLPGVRAFMVVRRLGDLGEVTDLEPSEEAIQDPAFKGRFRVRLRTERPADEVAGVIQAVGDVADVVILDTDAELAADEPVPTPAAKAASADGHERRHRHIRVDLDRLDTLMNQVGELVILRDQLRALMEGRDEPELVEAVERATRLVSELQYEVIGTRMVPVWQVFDRFPRLVRDAARALGKGVELRLEGREIELDRSMLEQIGDPIVHLLRNAVDHGIESPEERAALGKPERGVVILSASREQSRVVLRVRDDGRGIRRERIVGAALARGLIAAEEVDDLSRDQIHRLLLRPGFSTAGAVSDVSGRGVGLDAVATVVRSVGGVLDIESAEGRGTTFTIRLPLTLAIVQALLVRVASDFYAIPLAHVRETVEVAPEDVQRAGGQPVLELRDQIVPCLSLRQMLYGEKGDRKEEFHPAVIIEVGDQRRALFVDGLEGQREMVVKAFVPTRGTPPFFSGATILSDGSPALILDVGSVLADGAVDTTGIAAPT